MPEPAVREFDRVRSHSPERANTRIERSGEEHVLGAAVRGDVSRRLAELDREWDIERLLQTNAGALAFAGTAAAAIFGKRWAAAPAVIFGFMLQHSVQGWCPPVALFRRLGVRTRREIDRERYALKALRGDFDNAGAPQQESERA